MLLTKFKVLQHHGKQYIPDLTRVTLTEEFRGMPRLSEGADVVALSRAARVCPTGAISVEPLTLDLGKCLFCGECARIAPQSICFTNDYRIGASTREALVVGVGQSKVPFVESDSSARIRSLFGQALKLRQVSAGGDASVEMELNATGNVNFDFGRYGVDFVASPRHADGLVVTGPITAAMAEPLEICYEAIAEPKIIIVCGSECCSGGLFAGSKSIERSFLEQHKVDLWLPGAPTHPMTFIDGVMTLLGRKTR